MMIRFPRDFLEPPKLCATDIGMLQLPDGTWSMRCELTEVERQEALAKEAREHKRLNWQV